MVNVLLMFNYFPPSSESLAIEIHFPVKSTHYSLFNVWNEIMKRIKLVKFQNRKIDYNCEQSKCNKADHSQFSKDQQKKRISETTLANKCASLKNSKVMEYF